MSLSDSQYRSCSVLSERRLNCFSEERREFLVPHIFHFILPNSHVLPGHFLLKTGVSPQPLSRIPMVGFCRSCFNLSDNYLQPDFQPPPFFFPLVHQTGRWKLKHRKYTQSAAHGRYRFCSQIRTHFPSF